MELVGFENTRISTITSKNLPEHGIEWNTLASLTQNFIAKVESTWVQDPKSSPRSSRRFPTNKQNIT